MADKTFPLSVVIQAIDKVTAPMRAINQRINDTFKATRNLNNAVVGLGNIPAVAGLVQSVGILGTRIGVAHTKALALKNTLIGMTIGSGGAVWLFKNQFIDTADEFERMTISLAAIEGSADAAGRSMDFLKRMTVETPFEFQDLAKSFRIMKGFGLNPADGSLQSIADQAAKLGLRGEDLGAIAMQLGQAFSKTRLQAQDANILVEHGVPVWKLLQDAAARFGRNIPIAQLRKMSEDGRLGQKAVVELIKQMGIASKGASASMMTTWTGMLSNLKDYWMFFKLDVMSSGPFEWLKGKLRELLDTIEKMKASGELKKLAEEWGGKIVTALKHLYSFGKDLWGVLKDIGKALLWLHDLFGSWKPLIIAVGLYIAGPFLLALWGVATALWGFGAAAGALAVAMGPNFLAVLRLVSLAFGTLIAAAMFTPLGQLVTAATALAAAGLVVYENWDRVKRLFEAIGGLFSDMFGGGSEVSGSGLTPGTKLRFNPNSMSWAPAGESLGAGNLVRQYSESVTRQQQEVTITLPNLPRGARVSTSGNAAAPLNLNLGYTMVTP